VSVGVEPTSKKGGAVACMRPQPVSGHDSSLVVLRKRQSEGGQFCYIVTLSQRGSCHGRRSGDDIHRTPLREPVSAVVGAADRVRQQHHARVRRGLGRGRDQDDRASPGGQCRRAEDEIPARSGRVRPSLDAEAARDCPAFVLELGADLRQDARLVDPADRAHQEGIPESRTGRIHHGRVGAATRSWQTGRRWQRRARTKGPMRSS
jgi:hypothetical protein